MLISRRVLLAAALSLGALQAQAAVAPQALVAPITDYKLYVLDNLEQFTEHTRAFTDAVKAGDLARAQELYAPSRVYYERIEPIAELFADRSAACCFWQTRFSVTKSRGLPR